MRDLTVPVRVARITREAEGINSYELVEPQGGELPAFTAGAHIDVFLSGQGVRQYSLCNDPAERRRYLIAVLAEDRGEGLSRQLHQRVGAGDLLTVSLPRNRFPLVEDAAHYLLLAGGIGVTPLLSMTARLAALGADFTLHYCTRSPAHTPFRDRLAALADAGRVVYHHDGGEPSRGLDIAALLASRQAGTHLYYCGPAGFMRAVRDASAHWPPAAAHCEYFTPAAPPDMAPGRGHFQIMIAGSGAIHEVMPGESILEVLRREGLATAAACERGDCGLCRVRYLAGEPAHADRLLTDSERGEYVMTCRSRSRSPLLLLDP